MCFSATASFAAAGVTTVAGGVAMRAAHRPAQRLLAAIPVLFALHQGAEGFLWVALTHPEHAAWAQTAMFAFLVVAEVVWPLWVPLTIWTLEADPGRKRWLTALLVLGCALALTRAYGLVAYPVSAGILGQHIQYRLDAPFLVRRIGDVAYALATVAPPLVSSNRLVRVLGLLVLASLVLSKIFFYQTVISVWCFFAAVISALVVVVVKRRAVESQPLPAAAA
jgi:hypothetical protein